MPEINLPTKAGQIQIIDNIENVNNNVTNVKTAIDSSVGTNSDASSAAGTVHGKLKDIKTSLGNTSDAANSNGSIHAKLRDIRNNTSLATSPIRSVQRGRVALNQNGGGVVVNIGSVNPAKCHVTITSGVVANDLGQMSAYLWAMNATSLTIVPNSYVNGECAWEVVEFI